MAKIPRNKGRKNFAQFFYLVEIPQHISGGRVAEIQQPSSGDGDTATYLLGVETQQPTSGGRRHSNLPLGGGDTAIYLWGAETQQPTSRGGDTETYLWRWRHSNLPLGGGETATYLWGWGVETQQPTSGGRRHSNLPLGGGDTATYLWGVETQQPLHRNL